MSKKTAFIIIAVFLLLLIGGLLAFYFYTRGQDTGATATEGRTNIFPTPPTGGGEGTTPASPASIETAPLSSSEGNAPILKELSKRPSAGAVSLATSSNRAAIVRFMDRGTGNIYDVSPDNDGEVRVSNTTIPKIQEAFWNKDGTKVVARYVGDDVDVIKTYSAKLAPGTGAEGEGSLQGTYLTDNIRALAVNPEQNKLFYLLNHSGGSTGIVSEFDGTKKMELLNSPLGELAPSWSAPSQVSLATKPAAGVPGFLFLLNAKTGALTRAISNVSGLTALVSSDGSTALYSESGTNGLTLRSYSFKKGSSVDMAVATLPEKCVWSKNDPGTAYCAVPDYIGDGTYPDLWYKGLVSFSDELWKINTATGAGEIIAKLKGSAPRGTGGIDGISLFLSTREEHLFFTNKNDFHLWSLRLVP